MTWSRALAIVATVATLLVVAWMAGTPKYEVKPGDLVPAQTDGEVWGK